MIQIVGTQLSQWDVGRSVSIANSDATHIHFANQGDSKAVIIEITDGSAKIPDYLLQTGKSVIAYAVLDGVTLESKSFPVRKRERPENYVYEEDQRNYIYELIASAENATESANQAANSANTAAGSANLASTRANEAATSATDASAKANLAAKNANEATTKAVNAVKNMMVVGEAKGEIIAIDNAIDQTLVGLRVFGKTTQDGTPTPDAPVELVSVGKDGEVNTVVACVNLLPKASSGAVTQNGVTLTSDGKGNYTLRGTSVVGTSLSLPLEEHITIPHGVYFHLMNNAVSANAAFVPIFDDGTSGSAGFTSLNRSISSEEYAGKTVTSIGIYLQKGYTVDITFSPMLTVNSMAEEFDPYVGQTLTIATPNGLPGIGEYRDEIDFARGVYVHRVDVYSFAVADMNGSESYPGWRNAGIAKYYPNASNAIGRYGAVAMCNIESNPGANVHINTKDGSDVILMPNPNGWTQSQWKAQYPNLVCKLIVSIPAPIETPLSEEELASYAALHTYKDNTTVSNDAGAYMELEYVMDAKKYIDSLMAGGIVPAKVEEA